MIIATSLDEPAEFAEIFDRHIDSVHRFVSYRVGASDVDDVVAEVFRVGFEQRSTFRSSADSAKPWLLGIASNLTRRHHRSTARRRNLDVRVPWPNGQRIECVAETIGAIRSIEAFVDGEQRVDRGCDPTCATPC